MIDNTGNDAIGKHSGGGILIRVKNCNLQCVSGEQGRGVERQRHRRMARASAECRRTVAGLQHLPGADVCTPRRVAVATPPIQRRAAPRVCQRAA